MDQDSGEAPPFCDAIFLDRECHGILDDTVMKDVLAEYGTLVYSLRDRDGFMAYLNEIENAATPEHTNKLNEVYGDRYLRPSVARLPSAIHSADGLQANLNRPAV